MTLALVPHIAADATRLNIWVGIADVDSVVDGNLVWKLDRSAATPRAFGALRSWNIAGRKPFFTGFFEFDGLAPDSEHELELTVKGEMIACMLRTSPAAVPVGPQDRFNLLLLSCFHLAEDKTGNAGRVLSQLPVRPHLTILAGDQVYLDLPTLENFKDDSGWLEAKFQDDYLDNWFGNRSSRNPREIPAGYPQVLGLAPNAPIPDDHEYWNNLPFASPMVQNTWTEGGRRRWSAASELAYTSFQQSGAAKFGAARTIDVDPLSILLLDTRSQRNRGSGTLPDTEAMRKNPNDLLGSTGRDALEKWADALVQSAGGAAPRYGVLVTGQSLFVEPAGRVHGNVADFELPDYPADYQFIVGQVERVSAAGLPMLCLTGDVHWGRLLRAGSALGQADVFEVISSPTSLVTTVGIDELKQTLDKIKGVFGSRDTWPRHPTPDQPPGRFGTAGAYTPEVLKVFEPEALRGKPTAIRGNMALMLRFQRVGKGLDVEALYCPLHADDRVNAAGQWTTSFQLKPVR
jgi:hypothetical protein